MKKTFVDKIIISYLKNNGTIMFAYRAFQHDLFTGRALYGKTTWRTIYTGDKQDSFPAGWYPKEFDLEAFKAVAANTFKIPLGEDH